MPDKKEDTKTTIVESAAKGGMSAAMPYVAVIGGGLLAYKYLKDDAEDLIVGGGGRVIERTSETVKEIVKEAAGGYSDDPNTVYNLLLNPEMLPESQNQEIYVENPNKDYQSSTGTAGEWADFLTKGPIGAGFNVISEIGTAINPMPEDLKNTQKKLGSGNFSINDIANPDNPINKFLGFSKSSYASEYSKSSYTSKSDKKMGKGASSYAWGTDISPYAISGAGKKASTKRSTSGSVQRAATVSDIKDSGMPASNLKNAKSVSTSKDSSGKKRIVVKYKNGVTLRY